MSNYYYEDELKGDRETALSVVKLIAADFQRHISSSNKEAPKNGLRFALNMLTTFYGIYRSLKDKAHYDIFVKIYVEILAPHLDADASPAHFKRLLPNLRHLYSTLALSHLKADTEKLYKCIAEQQSKWTDAEDFKSLLQIHGGHIIWLLQSATTESHKIDETLANLAELFQFAQSRCSESELNAFDLTDSFMGSLKMNIARGCTLISSKLSKNQKKILFGSYFELLGALSLKPLVATISPEVACQTQLKATYNLLKIDVSNNLEQQFALEHLKICRSISQLKQPQSMADCLQLVYNLFKLSYVREMDDNFKRYYKRACEYFIELFKKSEKMLLNEVWFQDLLVLVYQLQISMSPSSKNCFYIFWEQFDATLFAMHFCFLKELHKALTYITTTEMLPRHAQTTFASVCIEIYGFMMNKYEFCNEEPFNPPLLTINESLKKIVERAKCNMIRLDKSSPAEQFEIQKFNKIFTNVMTAAKNRTQACFFIELSQSVKDLKSHLSSADWQLLLRRLYQLGAKTQQANTAAELHCCYISELVAFKDVQSVSPLLHNQIYFFYNGICAELIKQGNCLVEIYMQSKSAFKPSLQKYQIRFLHWLEGQYIFNTFKKDTHIELFANFAMRSQSKYDFLLAVLSGKLIDQQIIKSKVQSIYEQLRNTKMDEKCSGSNLKRMQELQLAHAAFLLWLERNEQQTNNLKSQDFTEENLSQLMQEKSLMNLNVQNEMDMIELALDALNAFKAFFEKADSELISASEGGFIDWLSILENLASLATYFQISGYIDYAIEAWLLHYRIAKIMDDTQNCMRGLTFFCEFNQLFDDGNFENFNILNEIITMQTEMVHILDKLPQVLKRNQNYTLICLCQIAYFYATKSRIEDACLCLKYVEKSHSALNRDSQYDIVLFNLDVVQFRILWKFNAINGAVGRGHGCQQNSQLTEIDAILKRLRDFENVSSVDATLYSLLIMSAVSDFAEFIANRLTENTLSSLFAICLKLSVNFGAAILTAKILSKWATINLQMEYLQKAELKFLLIESILGLRNPNDVAASLKSFKKSEKIENLPSLSQLNSGLELVRKAAVISPKALPIDKKQCISSMAFDLKLNRFLDIHKTKETVQRSGKGVDPKENLLVWTRYVLGALRARFNYLAKNNDELERFYESCKNWLAKRQHSFHYKLFYAEILLNMGFYANFLRASKRFDESIELLEMCLKQFGNVALAANVDFVYYLNLKLQLEGTKLEQLERKNRNLPKRKRLESTTPPMTIPKTPMNKTRYAQLPMTACKKTTKTPMAFTIYSDRKSPRKTVEKRELLNSNIRKDLKFTETMEKPISKPNFPIELSSDSESEEQQPKSMKKTMTSTQTKISKVKKTAKPKEDQLVIEHSMKNLTIKPKILITSESEELSPQASTPAIIRNGDDIFKTPITTLTTSSVSKSSAVPKRNTKRVAQLKSNAAKSSSGSSSDTCSTNSNEEQTTAATVADHRRLRTRHTPVIADGSKPTSTTTSSKRRPR